MTPDEIDEEIERLRAKSKKIEMVSWLSIAFTVVAVLWILFK